MMREFLGFESDKICAQLGIATSNCLLIPHRARLTMRGYTLVGTARRARHAELQGVIEVCSAALERPLRS